MTPVNQEGFSPALNFTLEKCCSRTDSTSNPEGNLVCTRNTNWKVRALLVEKQPLNQASPEFILGEGYLRNFKSTTTLISTFCFSSELFSSPRNFEQKLEFRVSCLSWSVCFHYVIPQTIPFFSPSSRQSHRLILRKVLMQMVDFLLRHVILLAEENCDCFEQRLLKSIEQELSQLTSY